MYGVNVVFHLNVYVRGNKSLTADSYWIIWIRIEEFSWKTMFTLVYKLCGFEYSHIIFSYYTVNFVSATMTPISSEWFDKIFRKKDIIEWYKTECPSQINTFNNIVLWTLVVRVEVALTRKLRMYINSHVYMTLVIIMEIQ